MDERKVFDDLKRFFSDSESAAFVKVLKDLRGLEFYVNEDGHRVRNLDYLNSSLLKDMCELAVLLQQNKNKAIEAADVVLNDKDKKIEELEKQVQELKDRSKDRVESVLKLQKQAKEKDALILSQQNTLETLKQQAEKQVQEITRLNLKFDKAMSESEDYLIAAEAEKEVWKQKAETKAKGKGSGVEMPLRVVREVVRLWCCGVKKVDIMKETGVSRGQLDRLVKGELTSAASIKKIVKACNQLLQKNQNKEFIEKVHSIKEKYV